MYSDNFIHDKANIEGDVELGKNTSVWAFASIRGDEAKIIIGDNSNIQEGVIMHGKTEIGNNVTVGHGAVVHGAKIGSNVLIGMNSTVLDGTEIDDWNIIAAGTVVAPNTKIEKGNVVMGVPGKITRQLNDNDRNRIVGAYQDYLKKLNKTRLNPPD